MKKLFMFIFILLLAGIVLIGASCGEENGEENGEEEEKVCLLYTSPSPRDATLSRMPSSA